MVTQYVFKYLYLYVSRQLKVLLAFLIIRIMKESFNFFFFFYVHGIADIGMLRKIRNLCSSSLSCFQITNVST